MATGAKDPDADLTATTGQPKVSLRLRFVRMLCWLGVCALALFALSNLWLWSPWATGVAEAELEKRSGQAWEIGSMSWSPWNGITLYDTRMLQPEELRETLGQPVMSVERIRVRPYWLKLMRGQIRPRSVEIESPEFTVSVEMLSNMASRTVLPKPPKPAPSRPPLILSSPCHIRRGIDQA